MNDQRQVIFSQRLNILKKVEIGEMIDNFLEELFPKFIGIKKDYNTSNDKKTYISSMKNFTGNAINDEKLLKLAENNDDEFLKSLKFIFNQKREEKIKLINFDRYNDLEKKIFLQILDFSWRAHIQYLEQLRQVIGLRSYGQKDPLSEFKKEAFTLFESLLDKIKIDIIKFLLNMNLVFETKASKEKNAEESKVNDKKVGRNEKCPCGSGKKYKHCCGNV